MRKVRYARVIQSYSASLIAKSLMGMMRMMIMTLVPLIFCCPHIILLSFTTSVLSLSNSSP